MTAAAHWRTVRAKLIMSGIADPLAQLPDMHAVLDVVESMIYESAEDKKDRQQVMDRLYAPDPADVLHAEGPRPAPAGFDVEDQMASFDAFIAAAR